MGVAGTVGPRSPLALALDVGSSSTRASLFDARGGWVRKLEVRVPYTPTVTPDGGAELDPDHLLEQVALSIDRLSAEAGRAVELVGAVGVSTFWHSLIGLDGSGRPVTPLYPWLDARSRGEVRGLREKLNEKEVHARTGCVLHWSYLPAKILWVSHNAPDAFKRVRRWVSFGEYLALRLFGRTAVGISMASGTGLFNQHTLDWDDLILSALLLDREQLSPLAGDGESFSGLRSEFAARWPFLKSVPWLPAVGDGASSNLGSGCTTRERLCLMVGTSAVMRVMWRADDVKIPRGLWCYRVDSRHPLLGAAMDDGGNLLGWLHSVLRLPGAAKLEQEIARMEPDGHGLTLLPLWAGERSPNWSLDATGAIVGLRLHTSAAEIARAAMEAIAVRFGQVLRVMCQAVPEVGEVVASGGALLHSPAWMQIMADALGRPVGASRELEASSRGAALKALSVLGSAAGMENAPPRVGRVFEPVAERSERYAEATERQARLYDELIGGRQPAGQGRA
ncbi:MAG TPA: gluconokinase [Chloroflexota bacterium]